MAKAGLIEEMTSEALDSALGGEDLEEETDEAVDAVLREVAGEVMAALPAAKARPVRKGPREAGGGGGGCAIGWGRGQHGCAGCSADAVVKLRAAPPHAARNTPLCARARSPRPRRRRRRRSPRSSRRCRSGSTRCAPERAPRPLPRPPLRRGTREETPHLYLTPPTLPRTQ
jgi:hypothetical protein